VLYDPGGDYRQDIKGSGDALYGADADLGDYIRQQANDSGPDIEVFHFPLTNEQDQQIIKNIENHGSCPPGTCAACTSDVLNGVGPFKGLGKYRFPSNLASRLRDMQGGSVTRGGGGGGW
jgi:hypothetical protein